MRRQRSAHPLLVALIATALGAAPALPDAPAAVGSAITVEETTAIATILAAPDDYAGKTVRVEGDVDGVCTRKGCWMDVADADGRRLRVQVDDGVLVFPAEAVGQRATVQGTVTIEELSRDSWIAWQRHLAEEGGKPFDETAVGEGPFRMITLAGEGARFGDGQRPDVGSAMKPLLP